MLAADEQCSFMDAAELVLTDERLGKAAIKAIGEFIQLIKDLRLLSGSLRSIVEIVAEKSGLMAYLSSLPADEATARRENVQEFFGVAAEFAEGAMGLTGDGVGEMPDEALDEEPGGAPGNAPGITPSETPNGVLNEEFNSTPEVAPDEMFPSGKNERGEDSSQPDSAQPDLSSAQAPETSASIALIAFMEWLALRSDLDTMVEGEDYVRLMTVHSAKGLEFKVVFIAGMEEGIFPHMMSTGEGRGVEEERRLAYVAITRARELLYLTSAQQRSLYGTSSSNQPSRFTGEIPATLIKRIGLGSQGIRGTGWEKRGSRRGIYGSGVEGSGRNYGGSAGRSYGGGSYSSGSSGSGSYGSGSYGSSYGSGSSGSGAAKTGSSYSGSAEGRLYGSGERSTRSEESMPPRENLELKPGDIVEHKVFGRGRVISVNNGAVEVQFEQNNKVRKLLIELAPLAKVNV